MTKFILSIIILFLLSLGVIASPCDHTKTSFHCVFYKGNYDGDTIRFDIPNVHPLLGKDIPIRLLGVDTPEIKSTNPCEKLVAQMAKDRVEQILTKATSINLLSAKKGSFFRIVADVVIDDGKGLSGMLLDEKLAVPYKSKPDWCQNIHYLRHLKAQ